MSNLFVPSNELKNSPFRAKKLEVLDKLSQAPLSSRPYKVVELNYNGVPIEFYFSRESYLNNFLEMGKSYFGDSSFLKEKSRDIETVRIFWESPEDFFDNASEWWDEESDPDLQFHHRFGVRGVYHRDFVAYKFSDQLFRVVCWQGLSDGFFNSMRWILPPLLFERKKLLIHSSTLLINEKVSLFLGPSGAGKSTIVNLASENHSTLGDDMNILNIEDENNPKVERALVGHGKDVKRVETSTYALNGIYILHKSNIDKFLPSSKAGFIKEMLSSICLTNWATLNEDISNNIIKSMDRLTQTIKVGELHFTKSNNFLEVI